MAWKLRDVLRKKIRDFSWECPDCGAGIGCDNAVVLGDFIRQHRCNYRIEQATAAPGEKRDLP